MSRDATLQPEDAGAPQPCTAPLFLPTEETTSSSVPTSAPATKHRPAKKKPAEGRARKHDGWWSQYAALHVLNNSSASSWKHILASVKQPTPQLGIEELQNSYLITDTTLSMPTPNVGTPALQQQQQQQPLFRPSFSALEAPEPFVPLGAAKRARRCSAPEGEPASRKRRRRSCPAAARHDVTPRPAQEETLAVRASPLQVEWVPDSAETTCTANESFSVFEDDTFQLDTFSDTSLPPAPPLPGAPVFALPGDETTRWCAEEPTIPQLYSYYFC